MLKSPAAGGATTPTTAVVTGTASNTTISVWQYSVNGGAFSATLPTGVTRSNNQVTITGSTITAATITVRMADANGIADTLTVAKISDGAKGDQGNTGAQGPQGNTGATGDTGAPAYTLLLTNEAHIFAGDINNALAGNTSIGVLAYKGTTPQSITVGTITGQVTGLTTSISNNNSLSPTINVTVTTALVATSGTLTIPLTVDGLSFSKTFAWSVSRKGATGAQGPQGNTGAAGRGISSTEITYQSGSSGTSVPTGSWVSAPPNVSAGQYLWTRTILTYTSGTPATTTHYSIGSMGTKIDSVTTTYQLSNSGTVTPVNTWLSTPPEQTDTQPFLWTRTITTYLGGPSTSTAYSVSRRGVSVSNVEMIYKSFIPTIKEDFEQVSNDLIEVFRNLIPTPMVYTPNVGSIQSNITHEGQIFTRINANSTARQLATLTDLISNVKYTYVVEVVNPNPTGTTVTIRWCDGPITTVIIKPNEQQFIRASHSRDYTSTYRYGAVAVTSGTSILVRHGTLVKGEYQGGPFTGDVSNDIDLEPSWTGTVDNSVSVLKGSPVFPSYDLNEVVGIASNNWFKTGSKSYRLIPNNVNQNASYISKKLSDYNLENYKTYTVAATLKLLQPQTGILNAKARTLSLNTGTAQSAQAPNAPGEHFLNFKFTIDGSLITLGSNLEIYNGAYLGGGEIYVDDLMIIEGDIESNFETWNTTIPSYDAESVLYRSERVTFSDGTISYSSPKIEPLWYVLTLANTAKNNANEALNILEDHSLILYGQDESSGLVDRLFILENDTSDSPETAIGTLIRSIGTTANSKNTTVRSYDAATNPNNYHAGDQWYKYKNDGSIDNFWLHNGDSWVETKLNGAIFGSVDAGVLTSGYIKAERIELNSIPRDRVNNLSQMLSDLANVDGAGSLAQAVRRLTSRITIGEGAIQIAASGTDPSKDLRMELDVSELAFYQGNDKVSYVNDNKLFIRNAEIATTIGDSLVFAAHDVFKGGTGALLGKVTVFRSI